MSVGFYDLLFVVADEFRNNGVICARVNKQRNIRMAQVVYSYLLYTCGRSELAELPTYRSMCERCITAKKEFG